MFVAWTRSLQNNVWTEHQGTEYENIRGQKRGKEDRMLEC